MTAQVDSVAARWRAPYLRRMLALKVDQSVDLYPEADDTLNALCTRVRKQAARYRSAGYYFRLQRRTDYIFVQRVEQDQRRKLAPFLRLQVGQKMPCNDPFVSEKETRNLRRRLLYLLDDLGHSVWLERHSDGALYYRCIGRFKTREPLWSEQPIDDGTDFTKSQVVCCPFDLKAAQDEFRRIKAAILASRADEESCAT